LDKMDKMDKTDKTIEIHFQGKRYFPQIAPEKTTQDLADLLGLDLHLARDTIKLIQKGKIVPPTTPIDQLQPPLLLTGTAPESLQEVQEKKPDSLVAPFNRPRTRSPWQPKGQESRKQPITISGPGFGRLEVLRELPRWEEAEALLERLAGDRGVGHVMERHGFRVGVLREMFPEGQVGVDPVCVLGLNRNQGQEIFLRLRTDDLRGFRNYERIKETLFHELAHNVHADHDDRFYALMRLLQKEARQGDWTLSPARSLAGDGGAVFAPPRPPTVLPEDDSQDGSSGLINRLGGDRSIPVLGDRERLAQVVERRIQLENQGQKEKKEREEKIEDDKAGEHEQKEQKIQKKEQEEIIEDDKAGEQERIAEAERISEIDLCDDKHHHHHQEPESPHRGYNDDPMEAEAEKTMEKNSPPPSLPSASPSLPPPDLIQIAGNLRKLLELPEETDERTERILQGIQDLLKSTSEQEARVAMETLVIYLSNALREPRNEKYRSIRAGNRKFEERVGRHGGAVEILKVCGFFLQGGTWLLCRDDPGLLWLGLSLLQSALSLFSPAA